MEDVAQAINTDVEQGPATADDEAEIRQVLHEIDLAWNAHDAARFAALFSLDADFTNVRGMQARNRTGVQRFIGPLLATMFADSEQRILRSRTRFLRGDLAAVDAWWTMRRARSVDGQARPIRYGLLNLVMRKEAHKGCRVLLWHNMELAAPPPEDPSAWRFVVFHNGGPADGPVTTS